MMPQSPIRAWLSLCLGVASCSTAVIFIKATHTPPIWLAAQRLLMAALILSPLAWRAARQHGVTPGWWRSALLPGLFLAIHFAAWSSGARMIPAANSTLIANLIPLAMPVVALVVLRERASRWDLTATAVGLAGVIAMAGGDLQATRAYLVGDGVCFGAMISVAIYLALSRRLRRGPLTLYMAPLYACAGVLCALTAAVVEGPPPIPSGHEALLVLGLASIPTVIGHTLINRAMGEIRPQAVSIAALGNVPLAGLMAWLLWRELPTPLFWAAAVTCVIAIAMVIAPSLRKPVQPAILVSDPA
jgi:drug/metabolite transporter (DMT)-like permease